MKRNISEKSLAGSQQTNKQMIPKSRKRSSHCFECHKESLGIGANTKRFLISVSVLGSPGPFRFLVNEEEFVVHVIDTALKLYSKEGRLPHLNSDPNQFFLYCANLGSDVMSPWDEIGSFEARNFVLCKKPEQLPNMTEGRSEMLLRKKQGSGWKSWLNKSLSLKILSH
uniref:DUF7054 domain-containing protein n=1 Tax=Opuntia streptacantha TaxID=393608 RepID=A0A7C8YMA5_OPUST